LFRPNCLSLAGIPRTPTLAELGDQQQAATALISERCGCRPKARQIRETVDGDNPVSWVVERVDQ